ncbi:hypothetical protein B9Z55_021324 [Caenorhabditis nigoni]|uniref:DUF281 domain-containing protein n=1 Tax=Caenorhabditis nigoni TaxID=1611254 RepID=A0A2G5TRG4_9PELO|nr:hypothetical protein B9Z55_021324 [Caenorhabditis nigoni]
MFFSIILLALLFSSAEMCGNLVQSNAPSKQSDIGADEAFAEVTFQDTKGKTCDQFITLLDVPVQGLFDVKHCTQDSLKLKITPKSGTCDGAIAIATNAHNKFTTTDLESAAYTCHGSATTVTAK